MEDLRPVKMQKTDQRQLEIEWNDGAVHQITFRKLRDACRCAHCNKERESPPAVNELRILSAAETQPLDIASMRPTGNYAYNIAFSDGHSSGLYTLETLRSLGTE